MEYAKKQEADKKIERNAEYLRWLRGQLVSGEQLQIAQETGFSYPHVRHVLAGKYQSPAPAIIRAAENKVFGRGMALVLTLKPVLAVRADFAMYLKQLIDQQSVVKSSTNNE